MSYSVLTVITLLISGFLVDKFTSRRILIYINIPLLLSVLVIIFFSSPISAFIFLGLIGISNGLANLLGSSIWAEIYGVKHIGSILVKSKFKCRFLRDFNTLFPCKNW